jgi:hypothetical protein
MLIDNKPLLLSSHALCLTIFWLSAMANETSTGSSVVKDARTANLRKGDVKSLAVL